MIVIALAMIYCDSVKFWECFYIDRRRLFFSCFGANLLYLVTKNHGFTDGNKRIAAGLFLYFLKRNKLLLRKDCSKRIADHTLVVLTVMIACSKPQEKELMVNLVMTFLK